MASYILRTIDPDLWERVKARSTADSIPLRAIILALLELYAAGKINVKSSIKATRVVVVLLPVLLAAGCHGVAETPTGLLGPSPVAGPPPAPTPLPSQPSTPFTVALEIVKPQQTNPTLLTWQAVVTVTATPGVVSPTIPASVEIDCGTGSVQRYDGFYGTSAFSCLANREGTYETRITARGPSGFSAQAAAQVSMAATQLPFTIALDVVGPGPVQDTGDGGKGREVSFSVRVMPDSRLAASYEFDFGDGTKSGDVNSHLQNHIYTKAGNFTAIVSVKSTDGRNAKAGRIVDIAF